MFAAVGKSLWPVYFHALKQLLKPRSRALIQSITISVSQFETYRTSSDFVREFIFPGGMLPSLERFVDTARRAGLAPEPVRAFGPDYARTWRIWPARFEARAASVRALRSTKRLFAPGASISRIAKRALPSGGPT